MAYSAGSTPASMAGSTSAVGSSNSAIGPHVGKPSGLGFDLQNQNPATNNIMASPLSPTDDIARMGIFKMGVLRKGKKGNKRFFVLHQETYGKPARLDCYASDKHYHKQRTSGGIQPKLSIPIKSVFNINKRVDKHLKHCISIYTPQDVLLLGCENEAEQEAWLQTLVTVLRNTKGGFGQDESARLNYDHVWDVNIVANRGLTEKQPALSGPYRLCMTHTAIFLYRKGEDIHSLEFPLVFVASYGVKGNLWLLRLGRTAMTGSGELIMETEDPSVAFNINETMKSIVQDYHDQRERSTSIGDRRQGAAWSGRSGSTVGPSMLTSSSSTNTSSSSLERSGSLVNAQSRSRAISESEKTLQSVLLKTGSTSSVHKMAMTRKISAPPSSFAGYRLYADSESNQQQLFGSSALSSPKKPVRKMTVSGGSSLRSHLTHPRSGVHPTNEGSNAASVIPGPSASSASSTAVSPVSPATSASITSGLFGRSSGHSPGSAHSATQWMPPGQSPLAATHGYSSENVGSGSSIADQDHGLSRYLHRQNFSERASSMEVVGTAIAEESSGSGAEYLPMQTGGGSSFGGGDDSFNKSSASSRASSTNTVLQRGNVQSTPRGDTYIDMGPTGTTGDRRRMTADSGYLEMARASAGSQLQSSNSSDHVAGMAGYTPMGPGSIGRSSSSQHSRQTSWHLEEVRSYISDSDNSSCSAPPSRAYSLGSRPNAGSETQGHGASYMAMGPPSAANPGSNTMAPSVSPMTKFGLFLTGRLGGGSTANDDRKRAHSVGSWNKPLWRKNIGASSALQQDTVTTPSSYVDPSAPSTSTSSSFYRPRSESFGSARSTPGSRRLMESAGSKLSNQSEDLVEMEFGRASIGRSPSGSLGSSESISRSRTSSIGTAAAINSGNGNAGSNAMPSLYGRQGWSPRIEQITEQDISMTNSPSGKLIQSYQQQLASTAPRGILSGEYVPMGASTNDSDYCAMMMGSHSNEKTTAIIHGSQSGEDYVPMSVEPNQNSSLSTAARPPTTHDPASKGPVRHSSGSSNLSLGNSNGMGLDSGVGGSSFSLDQQKSEVHVQPQQPVEITATTEQKATTSLSPMEQLKERLARVELSGAKSEMRKSACDKDDTYMQMDMTPKQKSSASVDSKPVRRTGSFAKTSSLRRNESESSQKPSSTAPSGSQSPSTSRSPLFKVFASFGKGGSTKQQPQQNPPLQPPVQRKSPTPSLKSVPSGSGGGDSRSRTPSASSKISLTESTPAAPKPQPRMPIVVTTSASGGETDPESTPQLEYATLDLQQAGSVSPTRQTPSPRPPSSCSAAGDVTVKFTTQQTAPPAMVNDGVVYASIDAARTTAVVADSKTLSSRQ